MESVSGITETIIQTHKSANHKHYYFIALSYIGYNTGTTIFPDVYPS